MHDRRIIIVDDHTYLLCKVSTFPERALKCQAETLLLDKVRPGNARRWTRRARNEGAEQRCTCYQGFRAA